MKLVIFGLSVSSAWGNGHATLWRGLFRELSAMGHAIVFFERDVPYYAAQRDLHAPAGWALRLYRDWPEVLPLARAELAAADVAMVTSYCPDGVAAAELVLDSRVPLRCFYDLDAPVTLACRRRDEPLSYVGPDGYAGYDLVLSYTGGATLQALRDELGARRTAVLHGSVDPALHHPVPGVERRYAMSYVGTYAADRQPVLEELLFAPASRLAERRFAVAGAQYPDETRWPANVTLLGHVAPPEHAAVYGASTTTLNITRAAMARYGYCPSARLFEAAACAVPVVTDPWAGLEQFFEPGREVLVARSAEDVIDLLDRSAAELDRIGQAARRRALAEHSARRRAEQLVAILADRPGR
jgi:spore maturation protein CgeB